MGDVKSEAAGGSEMANVWGALLEPRRTFARLAARPTFVIALLVLVVLGAASVWVGFSKVDPQDMLRSLEEQGRELPPSMVEAPEKMMGFMKWSAVAGAAVVAPLLYLAIAAIFLVALRLLGSEISYRQSLSVTLHGMLPLAVAALLGLVVGLLREQVSMRELESGALLLSHLGFLAGEESSAVVRALLTSVDLFSFWCIALLALGFELVARVSRAAAWGTVGVVWGLGIAVKALLALLR